MNNSLVLEEDLMFVLALVKITTFITHQERNETEVSEENRTHAVIITDFTTLYFKFLKTEVLRGIGI